MMERRVHAASRSAELVRYDRADKWYVEDRALGHSVISFDTAVALAFHWVREGGEVRFGVPGGRRFDARVRARLSEAERDGGQA